MVIGRAGFDKSFNNLDYGIKISEAYNNLMVKKISQINPQDRPQEKLKAKGATSLSDFELLKR